MITECTQHIYSRSMFQEFPRLCQHCGEPEPYQPPTQTTMTTRFDLEQQILQCWQITTDIPLLEAQGAGPADFTSLANVYEFKFSQLWETFEKLIAERKL